MYPDDAAFCAEDGHELTTAAEALVPARVSREDARIGTRLWDRYEFRRVVADGGTGRVYEALDIQERRNVAIKILHDEVAADRVSVERFKREADVSGELAHEYIADVIDFRPTPDGSQALVMEFLYGEELRATLKREKILSPERLVRMLSQVAIGLDGAHSRRLVHRDLKPDNIFLCQTREGDRSKVLDFGSVKDKAVNAKKLTVLGTTIGSPYYMSPEQAQALDTLDHRADVWSLAAITYEAVTGSVPFTGTTGPSILLAILTKEPTPPSEAGAGQVFPVPPALDEVIERGLRKQATSRYESVGAFADAVGHAYGLADAHQDWAVEPQADLRRRIAERMPELLRQPARTPRKKTPSLAEDGFFGEGDMMNIGRAQRGDARSPAANLGGGRAQHALTADVGGDDDWELPKRRLPWAWIAVVIAVAVAAAALIAAVAT